MAPAIAARRRRPPSASRASEMEKKMTQPPCQLAAGPAGQPHSALTPRASVDKWRAPPASNPHVSVDQPRHCLNG